MRTVALYQMVFGLTLIVLALTSYASDHSGLIAGGIIAGLMLMMIGIRLQKGWRTGLGLALVLAFAIAGFGLGTWIVEKGPFVPQGLTGVLAAVSIATIAIILLQPKERKRGF